MLPGFITLFKDEEGFVHLYFFQGLTDEDRPYYNKLNLQNDKYKYTLIEHQDHAFEYIFENKKIRSMTCNLVSYTNKNFNTILSL